MPVDVSTNQQAAEKIVPLGTKNGIELAIRGLVFQPTQGRLPLNASVSDRRSQS